MITDGRCGVCLLGQRGLLGSGEKKKKGSQNCNTVPRGPSLIGYIFAQNWLPLRRTGCLAQNGLPCAEPAVGACTRTSSTASVRGEVSRGYGWSSHLTYPTVPFKSRGGRRPRQRNTDAAVSEGYGTEIHRLPSAELATCYRETWGCISIHKRSQPHLVHTAAVYHLAELVPFESSDPCATEMQQSTGDPAQIWLVCSTAIDDALCKAVLLICWCVLRMEFWLIGLWLHRGAHIFVNNSLFRYHPSSFAAASNW